MNLRKSIIRAGAAIGGATAILVFSASHIPRESHAGAISITVYKSPYCGCCSKWVDHLRANGFKVNTVAVDDMLAIKAKYNLPQSLTSCHTAVVDGRIIEGHVPADLIRRFLSERTDFRGLAVPGMPIGSPGMEGPGGGGYNVIAFGGGRAAVYAHR